jgi:flagellin
MPITIGSNIASLQMQRSLGRTTNEMSRTFERLSSGMRITRASDDAAGVAIADSLRSSSRVANIGIRNINDGLSALSIMDGALDQQVGILGRVQELAEQSANGTFSFSQRSSLQKELESLRSEFFRIADTTIFNGIKLMKGGDSLKIQADITGRSEMLLAQKGDQSVMKGVIDISKLPTDIQLSNFIVKYFEKADFTEEQLFGEPSSTILRSTVTDQNGNRREAALMLGQSSTSGSLAGIVFLKSLTDPNIWEAGNVEEGTGISLLNFFDAGSGNIALNSDGSITGGSVITIGSSNLGYDVQFDLGSILFKSTAWNIGTNNTGSSPFELMSIYTQAEARKALDYSESLRQDLLTLRASLGASQSRFKTAGSNLQQMRENFIASESRIRDVDIGEETSNLVRNQILQQSTASLLAQANQIPALALVLLRG